MNRDSMKALRHDRRLLSRRGWITADALEKELASLPDVADKAQAMDADADPAGSDAPASGGPESPTGG
jgi:hypothetical protein